MSEKNVIQLKGIHKDFKLPHQKASSVKALFTSMLKNRKTNFEKQHALKDISFEIKEGEFFGIVGRNGSGKSTLLKILAEIYRPTKGSIVTRGKLVPFIELGVGFNPELTGRENVYLNGALLGFDARQIDQMYDDIVEFAELEKFMDQKLKNYSSGMQVRLAFSVATRSQADILLIDEVLAVGDADFQRKCFQYFRELKKQKTTVVFVSHDMEAVREYCDRCVLIDKSEVVYTGSPTVAAEKYIQLFNDSFLNKKPQEKNEIRWGDGAAKFSNVSVKRSNSHIQINTTIDFIESMEDPIIGFSIKNAAGDILCGTNNKILEQHLDDFKGGESARLEWVVPNIFGEDEFTVEAAITHNDNVTQADWWHNAATFTNTNNRSTPHPVSPPVTLLVK